MDIFFNLVTIVNMLVGLCIAVFFVYSFVISLKEKEPRAAFFSLFTGFVLFVPFVFVFSVGNIFNVILFFIVVISGLLFLYNPSNKKYAISDPVELHDERDTMFSRKELQPGTEKFDEYYERRPEYKNPDDRFRGKPGLADEKAAFYHPFTFAAADATFFTVDALASRIKGEPLGTKKFFSPEENIGFLKQWAKKLGALDVGVTKLKEAHFYSYKGRKDTYGKLVNNSHKYALAFTVEMNKDMVDTAPYSPIIMESAQQYLHAGAIAVQLAAFIRNIGFEATAHIDGNYELICPLVARDAGLGEIGRMGLLMTPKQGPRVRIGVVSTNLPLLEDEPLNDTSIVEFCTYCKKCADVCPSRSISFTERAEINGAKRWKINSEACFTYWCTIGTDCGRCMKVCPYSHPDNFMHNLVRIGIKKSFLFRKIAVYMDDLFYGRKPLPSQLPKWIPFYKKKKVSIEQSVEEFYE